MSDTNNDQLLDKATDLLEDITDHPSGYDKLLSQAIKRNDMEELQTLVTKINGYLAQNYFYKSNILEREDEF